MIFKFSGGEAEKHRIDLYTGSESLSGIGRAANLVGHYVATGKVRYRAPYSNKIQFYIAGTEAGSLNVVIDLVSRMSNAAAGLSARSISAKLLHRVVSRAVGQAAEGVLEVDGRVVPAGDVDALAEAATPGLERAHRWIDTSSKSIQIDSDGDQEIILDLYTKEYLESEKIDKLDDLQDVSVGALNVNSRTGRVYFEDLGRTVGFYVPKDAVGRTIPTLSRFLTQYAENTGATVNIKFKRVRYQDDRLKRIIISDCYPIQGER